MGVAQLAQGSDHLLVLRARLVGACAQEGVFGRVDEHGRLAGQCLRATVASLQVLQGLNEGRHQVRGKLRPSAAAQLGETLMVAQTLW